MPKQSNQSATDILAFLVIECNMPLPYSIYESGEISFGSPLYESLVKVWNLKNRRNAENNAFLASCIYNAAGAKTTAKDFLPRTRESLEEEEQILKANLIAGLGVTHRVSKKP